MYFTSKRKSPSLARSFGILTLMMALSGCSSHRLPDFIPPTPAPSPGSLCTPAPLPPPGAPSDWAEAVHGNCFSNLGRLELWTGGTRPLSNGESPEGHFQEISPGSIGREAATTVRVLVHGWAPGYRENVVLAGGKLQWWSDGAGNADGVWPSAWAWVPTSTSDPVLTVTETGVFQEFQKPDPRNAEVATVLGFSWTDDSATDGSFLDLFQVYQSEAYTNLNGLRLAHALEQALHPAFWEDSESTLHIVGHSHGAKVATVAALTLQKRNRRVDRLTVLDSPESEITLMGNGSNLLGFYLNQLEISTGPGSPGAFVDNYVSEFGAGFEGRGQVDNLVEIMLDPSKVYGISEAGDKHSYAAAWYGGALTASARFGLPPVGLAWPPAPCGARAQAFNQEWRTGVSEREQWLLTLGPPIDEVRRFSSPPQTVTRTDSSGHVTFEDQVLTLRSASGNQVATAVFVGDYRTSSSQYGLGFDIEWSHPGLGGYVVITGESPEERVQEVLLVLEGGSMPPGKNTVSINADVSSLFWPAEFQVFYVPVAGNSEGVVTVSGFRKVISECEQNCLDGASVQPGIGPQGE